MNPPAGLTRRQTAILRFIHGRVTGEGRPPTLREIRQTRAGRLGTSSEFVPQTYEAQVTAEGAFRGRWAGKVRDFLLSDFFLKLTDKATKGDANGNTSATISTKKLDFSPILEKNNVGYI